jgi:cytochrome c biogenesis protein CcdA
MANAIENVVAMAFVLLFVGLLVAVYFAPTIIALQRQVPNAAPLIVVNVFFGWTLLGWVLAFAFAVRDVPSRHRVPQT